MKLDNKKTVLVGFAFLAISAFWQMYDSIIPLILKYFFGIGDTLSGGIMALDNIFALILLPVFGAWSDRVNSKRGKRTPFILVGTILSVVFMLILPAAAFVTMTMVRHGDSKPEIVKSRLEAFDVDD